MTTLRGRREGEPGSSGALGTEDVEGILLFNSLISSLDARLILSLPGVRYPVAPLCITAALLLMAVFPPLVLPATLFELRVRLGEAGEEDTGGGGAGRPGTRRGAPGPALLAIGEDGEVMHALAEGGGALLLD